MATSSIVALKFKDGVVVGADTLVSYGSLYRYHDVNRLFQLNDKCILTGSGSYADLQNVKDILDSEMRKEYSFDPTLLSDAKAIHSLCGSYMTSFRNKMEPRNNELVIAGMKRDGKPFLGFSDSQGTTFEEDKISTGFGNYMGLPHLRELPEANDLSKDDAKNGVIETFQILLQRHKLQSNKIILAIITNEGIEMTDIIELKRKFHGVHLLE
eukprot:TRINITY_DN1657_c0_g1_i1.p1 TRINITY_DN1657_c0_g1~~TRINITY_DN1657_c0_g1_i1.p1  ORF type:complete len:220 (-),score=60.37 TRINITY_DN1657_c0_g1_i1:164-799(-)